MTTWRREYYPMRQQREKPYKYQLPSNGPEVKLYQSWAGIGTTVWDGAIALARYVEHQGITNSLELSHLKHVGPLRIVELGAGLGLNSISLAYLLAKEDIAAHITVTESASGKCLDDLRKTVDEFNDKVLSKYPHVKLDVEELTWGDAQTNLLRQGKDCQKHKVDIILGAEILYEAEAAIAMAESVDTLCKKEQCLGLFSHGRNRAGRDAFEDSCRESNFTVIDIPPGEQHPKFQDAEVVKMFKMRR
eukprot:Clim_evm36s150 gene=Clim_evmTU36s150